MADFVLANGLGAASLRPLAASAGISDRMLLYYFKDKPAVMAAILQCLVDRLTALLAAKTITNPLPAGPLRNVLYKLTAQKFEDPGAHGSVNVAERLASELLLLATLGVPMYGGA